MLAVCLFELLVQVQKLAKMFKENFTKYTGPGVTDYTMHGPK